MVHATRRLVENLSSRPAACLTTSQAPATPAPRTSSRLASAVVVKPAEPTPAPAAKGRSRSAAPALVVAPPPKVVRVKRDPAVAAAEAERKLQVKAAADAELARVAEEARVATKVQAEADRIAAEQRTAAERARQADASRAEETREAEEATLRTERDELVGRIRIADMEVFQALWVGQSFSREQIVAWVESLDSIATVRDVRRSLDDQIAKHSQAKARAEAEIARKAEEAREQQEAAERELKDARKAFIEAVRRAPDAFFVQTWEGKHSRSWFEENISRGDMDWIGKTRTMFDAATGDYRRKEALALAEERRDQARRDAEAEKARKKLDPKSKHFDMKAYLVANAVQPVEPVGPRPSKVDLAALDLRVNGASAEKLVISYVKVGDRSLDTRIESLDPMVVARLHREKPEAYYRCWRDRLIVLERVTHTWPNVDRLLNALRSARGAKVGGQRTDDASAISRIEIFVAWCERG